MTRWRSTDGNLPASAAGPPSRRGGVSHSPAEYASPDDIDIGARVLLDFIDHLAPANA